MRLLTIGSFARASRLSPKALRLYDELGLLRPARVDPLSAYRSGVESDTEARRRLTAFLIDYLSGKDTAMPDARTRLGIRYAVRSDVGQLRESNEDAAYAGPRLLAVADGLGGHAGGEV